MSDNDPWTEINDTDVAEGVELLKKEMRKSKINKELADEVISQVEEIKNEKHNIIFVFTDNEWAVTGIHVPDEAIGDEESPVLMRGANPKHIIAAFSQSEIRNRIKIADGLEIIAGLNNESAHEAENAWIEELEKMCQEVRIKIKNNPPEQWEDLLK